MLPIAVPPLGLRAPGLVVGDSTPLGTLLYEKRRSLLRRRLSRGREHTDTLRKMSDVCCSALNSVDEAAADLSP